MKKLLISILILAGLFGSVKAQDTDLRELFLAAESYYLFEEFNEALPLYLRIHRHFPDNDNINFKIGVCFLNNPYEKNKSVMYLEKAVENINPKYRDNSFKETGAPLESIFYLANAYRVNNQLSKARNYYNIFLTRMDPNVYDGDLVNEQLAACDAAESLMKKPIDFDMTSLSSKINTRFADMNPVVSGDETKMAFISKLQFYDAVFYSEKVNGEWNPPRNIVPELGVDGDVYPTALSYNGTELLVYRNDDYIGNIYYSRLVNEKWTPLQKLDENINTKYWESHASFSKDGKTLYFSSNRKGGFGGLDIYKSARKTNGTWGPAENLGAVINTKYNDDTPFVTEDEDKIYFSSYGHYSMGGYDLFMSKKDSEGVWAQPVNLGFPLNTTDDDQFYLPLKNGSVGYYSRYSAEGFGRHDILIYEVYTPDNPRLFNISGLIDFYDETTKANEILVSVVEKQTKDTVNQVNPDSEGNFNFKIPAGKYNVIFDSEKFKQHIESLEVSPESPHQGFAMENHIELELRPIIIPPVDISDYLIIREDSIIEARTGEKVKIKYSAEPGTKAKITVINDSLLVYSDSLEVDKKRQSFEFIPLTGKNEVTISLQDKDGNITRKSIDVLAKEFSDTDTEQTNSSELSGPQSQMNELESFRQALLDNTEGKLNAFIQSIDTKHEGIQTKDELLQYLYDHSEENGLSQNEIDTALLSLGELNQTDILLKDLQQLANPQLSKYIERIDSEEFKGETAEDFFSLLYSNADKENYSSEDVDLLVQKYKTKKHLKDILEELEQSAKGELKTYLQNLDLEKEGISSYNELFEHLIKKTEEGKFSEQEVRSLLNQYSNSKSDPSDSKLRNSLSEIEALDKMTSNISDESIETMTDQQVYEYLFENTDSYGVETEELIRMLIKADNPDIGLLIEGLKITEKDLSDLLDKLPDSITNAEQLIDYLCSVADNTEGLDRNMIIDAYRKYLENKDLYDFLNTLKKYSDDDLLTILENIDLNAEGITSRTELVNFLLNHSDQLNISKQDIYEAVTSTDNDLFMRQNINQLIEKANPALKKALLDFKQNNIGILSIDDLVAFLLQNADKYAYSKDDVLKLLSKNSKTDKDEITEPDKTDSKTKTSFKQGLVKTLIILFIEGLIIFILILLAKKKKKNEEPSSDI